MTESWAIIEGYNAYAVSNHGRVRNLNTGNLLKPQSSKRGGEYLFVNLYRDRQRKNANVHALVAAAFLGPRPQGAEVHHKDTNRHNPRLDNLEYLTPADHGKTRRRHHHSGALA